MATTYVDTTASGGQTDFEFTFPYLEDEHVKVEINGVATTAFTIVTSPSTKIVLDTGATAGEIVRVQRVSAPDENLVDFQNGSVLTESELDRAYLHNRYLAEESAEQNDVSMRLKAGAVGWDGLNKRILNIVDPVDEQDVATKNYVDGVIGDVALGEVPDDSITYAKLQDAVGNNVLLGNDNGPGEEIQELSATEVRSLLNVADGAETGTVVSIASGTGLTGGPITASGTISLAPIADLRALGNVSGSSAAPTAVEIKDEDNMVSDSATALATQQSIKAYVDSRKYDTGWVDTDGTTAVGAGNTLTFSHTLGNAALGSVFSVYAAKDSSGTDMQQALFSFWEDVNGTDAATGIQITSITNSVVNLQLSANGIAVVNSSGTVPGVGYVPFGSGNYSHIRLVLIG
jgi:hypothetical protein